MHLGLVVAGLVLTFLFLLGFAMVAEMLLEMFWQLPIDGDNE